MSLIFERVLTDGIAAISYLIGDDEEGTAAVIDPRPDVEIYLELARKNRPNVIVSDLHMPGIGGCEFIRRVRQTPELMGIPAIALTGYSLDKEVNLALAAGFDAHLTKPVDGKTVSDMIARLLTKCLKKAS